VRRVQSIEKQRTAGHAEREQRIAESAVLAERQKELAAIRSEALALTQTIAAQSAGRAPAVGGDGDRAQEPAVPRSSTPLKTARAASSRTEPSCTPISEYLEASCLGRGQPSSPVLRSEACSKSPASSMKSL